jgi:hypothetical protein
MARYSGRFDRDAGMTSRLITTACRLPMFVLLYLTLAAEISASAEDARPTMEYQIKASLLFNFIHFVTWAPEPDSSVPLRTCVTGADPFGPALKVFEREVIHGRKIETVILTEPTEEQLKECSVVFVLRGHENVLDRLSNFDPQILTVGETPEFLDRGGIITLLLQDNKIVFDVNRNAALRARLAIDSKLLRMARTVRE